MNYLDWNIVEDDFLWAQDQWEKGHRSWLLVRCKVLYEDKIYNWSLHYDEYMYRKLHIQINQMIKENNVPLSVLHEAENEIQFWKNEIKERHQGERDAGDDL